MLPIQTILHPTDLSERSKCAFRLACSLARDYDARIIVLHVAEPPAASSAQGVLVPQSAVSQDALREMLRQQQPTHPNISVEHQLAEGDAAAAILRVAQDTNADVIVMGTHGRTGLGRLLMGSVAEQIVRDASCPVVTVKTPLPQAQLDVKAVPEISGKEAVAGRL
jgi:nucleotide-binding universal stress UspA family protein